jgi:hypothetical protein
MYVSRISIDYTFLSKLKKQSLDPLTKENNVRFLDFKDRIRFVYINL